MSQENSKEQTTRKRASSAITNNEKQQISSPSPKESLLGNEYYNSNNKPNRTYETGFRPVGQGTQYDLKSPVSFKWVISPQPEKAKNRNSPTPIVTKKYNKQEINSKKSQEPLGKPETPRESITPISSNSSTPSFSSTPSPLTDKKFPSLTEFDQKDTNEVKIEKCKARINYLDSLMKDFEYKKTKLKKYVDKKLNDFLRYIDNLHKEKYYEPLFEKVSKSDNKYNGSILSNTEVLLGANNLEFIVQYKKISVRYEILAEQEIELKKEYEKKFCQLENLKSNNKKYESMREDIETKQFQGFSNVRANFNNIDYVKYETEYNNMVYHLKKIQIELNEAKQEKEKESSTKKLRYEKYRMYELTPTEISLQECNQDKTNARVDSEIQYEKKLKEYQEKIFSKIAFKLETAKSVEYYNLLNNVSEEYKFNFNDLYDEKCKLNNIINNLYSGVNTMNSCKKCGTYTYIKNESNCYDCSFQISDNSK